MFYDCGYQWKSYILFIIIPVDDDVQDFVFQVANEVADEWSALLENQKLPLSVHAFEFALKATLYTLFDKRMRDEVEIRTFKRKYDEVRSMQTFTEKGQAVKNRHLLSIFNQKAYNVRDRET